MSAAGRGSRGRHGGGAARAGSGARGIAVALALAAAALALVAALALAPGCADNPAQPTSNRPPETGLVFVGDLDTTLYIQEIRWWGSDADGEVVGFYHRWTAATPAPGLDTAWTFTTAVRDTFTLPVPDGLAAYTFAVRAVDDRGLLDPTPATQVHPFRNAAPYCSLTTVDAPDFPDTLFPSFTLRWAASDPDGDATIARFLVWHDGREANPIVVENGAARLAGLGPEDFAATGDRTIYIQAVDSGQRGSPPDSFQVHLLATSGRVLLVDDMPALEAAGGTSPDYPRYARFADFFYATNLDTAFGAGAYTILDLERYPIQTPEQARRLLDAFDTIVWYDTISDSLGSPSLAAVRDLLPGWIAGGGGILLSSTYAIGTNTLNCNPALNRCDTVPEALYPDRDPRFRRVTIGISNQVRNGRSITSSYVVRANAELGLEDVQWLGGFSNASFDVFDVQAAAVPLYTLAAGTVLGEGDTLSADGRVGVLKESGEGRFLLVGFPFSRMRALGNHHTEFRKLLRILAP